MPSFSAFDSRGYRTVAPREGYDRWARNYEDTVEDAMDLALLERIEVDWAAAGSSADLGCGTGRTGAWLKARGAVLPSRRAPCRSRAALRRGHVHLLSDHVAAGRAAGLELLELQERVVDDEWVALKPKWGRFRDHPISFAFVWVGRA